jgi:hypothetical protein
MSLSSTSFNIIRGNIWIVGDAPRFQREHQPLDKSIPLYNDKVFFQKLERCRAFPREDQRWQASPKISLQVFEKNPEYFYLSFNSIHPNHEAVNTQIPYLCLVKLLIVLIVLLTLATASFGQSRLDSLQERSAQVMDSAQSKLNAVTRLPEMPDSVKASWQKVDSVRNGFNAKADSIKGVYDHSIGAIDAQQQKLQHKIDSLSSLKLPSNKYTQKLDSLNQKKTQAINDLNSGISKLKEKTIGKLNKIELTPEMQGPVGEFTGKINNFNISDQSLAKLPALDVPGYSLPKIEGIKGLEGIGNLPKIETPLGNVGDVGKQINGLGSDVKNITQGNLSEVKQIPQSIEQQAAKIDGVKALQKESAVVDGYKEQLGQLQTPDGLKQQGQAMIQKEVTNHFAGKEKELQAAMSKIAKYKNKYASVSSLKDLPKRPPNAMKGKPFIERLVPGVYLQYQIKNARLFDVNPYLGYKISGRFTSGLGWNQRFAYNKHIHQWVTGMRVFGPRAYVDAGMGRGFILHLNVEAMNTFVPFHSQDGGQREWVWSTMVGLKKQYNIYKNLNGTVLMQYNLINKYFRTPYVDRLNSRIGFEYMLHKRQKKQGL